MRHPSHQTLALSVAALMLASVADASLYDKLTEARTSANSVSGLQDHAGKSMDGLEVQQESDGSYVGVYHTLVSGDQFCLYLATSADLKSGWTQRTTVDCDFASQGALRRLSDGRYLLAFEKNNTGHPYIQVRLYSSLTALLANNPLRVFSPPLVPNSDAQGTPNFRWIRYDGNPDTMTVELGFHYYRNGRDYNAIGFLRRFSQWDYYENTHLNRLLDAHVNGNMGDRTFIVYQGRPYTVIEGQGNLHDFPSFRLYLHDEAANTLTLLPISTPNGNPGLGNASLSVVRDASGNTKLVMPMYVFGPPWVDTGEHVFVTSLSAGDSTVNQTSTVTPPVSYAWDARSLPHAVGQWEADGWSVHANVQGHMVYGPYESRLPFAPLRAWFSLLVDNNSANNDPLMNVDIYDATAGQIVASRVIRRGEFSGAQQWQWFHLDFDWRYRNGHQLETRVYTYGKSYIKLNQVLVRDGY